METLYIRVRKSFQQVMHLLLLRNEFNKIDDTYMEKNNSKQEFGESLLKMIMRVCKMNEARNAVSKIVGLIYTRSQKISWLKDELALESERDLAQI